MIQQRLKTPENNTEQDLINRLVVYHRHIEGVQTCLQATLKAINVDQPKGDVFNQSMFNKLDSILTVMCQLWYYWFIGVDLNMSYENFRE